MKQKDVFKIWSPPGARWIEWIKPIHFIAIDTNTKQIDTIHNFKATNILYITELKKNTAVIIDLPGHNSITEAITLANLGFRPIPLYNGTIQQQGSLGIIDNHTIKHALIWGAYQLKNLEINNFAPPVFLLDSNRVHRFKMNISVFDNSWDIYEQDFPSSDYFLKMEINQIIVRAEIIQKDLMKILYKYQSNGIKILWTNGYEIPKQKTIKKLPLKINNHNYIIL